MNSYLWFSQVCRIGIGRKYANHSCKMGRWGGGGAALTSIPSRIPLKLKQEMWAAGFVESFLQIRKREIERESTLFSESWQALSFMSFIPPLLCVCGKEARREGIRRERETKKSMSMSNALQERTLAGLTICREGSNGLWPPLDASDTPLKPERTPRAKELRLQSPCELSLLLTKFRLCP